MRIDKIMFVRLLLGVTILSPGSALPQDAGFDRGAMEARITSLKGALQKNDCETVNETLFTDGGGVIYDYLDKPEFIDFVLDTLENSTSTCKSSMVDVPGRAILNFRGNIDSKHWNRIGDVLTRMLNNKNLSESETVEAAGGLYLMGSTFQKRGLRHLIGLLKKSPEGKTVEERKINRILTLRLILISILPQNPNKSLAVAMRKTIRKEGLIGFLETCPSEGRLKSYGGCAGNLKSVKELMTRKP